MILAHLAVLLAIQLSDLLLRGVDAQAAQVHRVRTHVRDASVFIEVLCHHHRLTHGVAQLACGFLLQGRGGEWGRRRALHRLLLDSLYGEGGILAFVQERHHFLLGLETLAQRGLHLCHRTVGVGNGEDTAHVVVCLALEGLYLALTLYDKTYGNTLHTTGREGGLHLAPQHGRQLETYQTVEHTTGLLGIHQVHVQRARMLDGIKDSGFGNLVEHDTLGLLLIQSQHLTQVPRDGFSLAVFIGCEPYLTGFLGLVLQFTDQFLLLIGNLVFGFQGGVVDTQLFLLQVADMSVTRHDFIVLAKKFLNRLGLGG